MPSPSLSPVAILHLGNAGAFHRASSYYYYWFDVHLTPDARVKIWKTFAFEHMNFEPVE